MAATPTPSGGSPQVILAVSPAPCEPMTITRLFTENDDVAEFFASQAKPAVLANLCATSKDLAAAFSPPRLWASQLESRFGVTVADAAEFSDPRRELARRAVCAAIESLTATSPVRRQRTTPAPTDLPETPPPPAWAARFAARGTPTSQSWSPEGSPPETNKENRAPHRRPLTRLHATPQSCHPPDSQASASSASTACKTTANHACVVSRLRSGMRQIVMGTAGDAVTACPKNPDDWSTWAARVTCPRDDGALVCGMAFELQLVYPMNDVPEMANDDAHEAALPRVVLNAPSRFYHPNVHPTSGVLCTRALGKRCSPVDLVGDQLVAVLSLLRRPVFSVPPLNVAAAASWYGDAAELRTRVQGAAGAAAAAQPTPLSVRRVVSLGL